MVEANKQPQDEQHRNPVSEISDFLESTFNNKESNLQRRVQTLQDFKREVSIDLIELGTRHDALM
jgi:hypothetical protein